MFIKKLIARGIPRLSQGLVELGRPFWHSDRTPQGSILIRRELQVLAPPHHHHHQHTHAHTQTHAQTDTLALISPQTHCDFPHFTGPLIKTHAVYRKIGKGWVESLTAPFKSTYPYFFCSKRKMNVHFSSFPCFSLCCVCIIRFAFLSRGKIWQIFSSSFFFF